MPFDVTPVSSPIIEALREGRARVEMMRRAAMVAGNRRQRRLDAPGRLNDLVDPALKGRQHVLQVAVVDEAGAVDDVDVDHDVSGAIRKRRP